MKEKIKSGLLFLAVIAGCFVISVPYRYLHEQTLIDHCLFGKHGSFNYSSMLCDFHENHVYVPYRVRHPHDKSIALVAVLSFVLFLSGYGFMRVSSKNG
ncbi:MAG: hypothetical protein ABSD76_02935 [Terriglobales bacterium]|jgi:hypothetical protein